MLHAGIKREKPRFGVSAPERGNHLTERYDFMSKKSNAPRKDGRIAVQVYIGRDEHGKRKYKTVYGKTQKEADQKATELKAKLGKGIDLLTQNDTFGKWQKFWWTIKQARIGSGSAAMYHSMQNYLSGLSQFPICKVSTADIDAILAEAAAAGSAKETLRKIRMTASQIFEYAIDNRVIDYNPAIRASIPEGSGKTERRALTDKEQQIVREMPHRAQTAAMIMLYAGLRRGEVLALTWSDIDLDAKTITVNKTVEMIHGKPALKLGAKTRSGNRVITIPDLLVSYLRTLPQKTLLVCPNTKGQYMSSSAWRSLWHSYILQINHTYGEAPAVKIRYAPTPITIDFTAHCLRHTYATILYKSGVDVLSAQYLLGHSNVQTTLSIYTHLDAEMKKRSVDNLNAFLNGANKNASSI